MRRLAHLPARRARALGALAVVLALAAAPGAGGCITPSIPIPPPDAEQMVFDVDVDAGEATFSYPPNSNYGDAVVYVFNRSRGVGVIATARPDGSVGPTAPFPAAYGEQVAVTFEADQQVVSTCVVLREGGPTAADSCLF